ncbi:MAG: hypothetical protein ACE1ZK_07165, partial [Nitrospirales bacterium]
SEKRKVVWRLQSLLPRSTRSPALFGSVPMTPAEHEEALVAKVKDQRELHDGFPGLGQHQEPPDRLIPGPKPRHPKLDLP